MELARRCRHASWRRRREVGKWRQCEIGTWRRRTKMAARLRQPRTGDNVRTAILAHRRPHPIGDSHAGNWKSRWLAEMTPKPARHRGTPPPRISRRIFGRIWASRIWKTTFGGLPSDVMKRFGCPRRTTRRDRRPRMKRAIPPGAIHATRQAPRAEANVRDVTRRAEKGRDACANRRASRPLRSAQVPQKKISGKYRGHARGIRGAVAATHPEGFEPPIPGVGARRIRDDAAKHARSDSRAAMPAKRISAAAIMATPTKKNVSANSARLCL